MDEYNGWWVNGFGVATTENYFYPKPTSFHGDRYLTFVMRIGRPESGNGTGHGNDCLGYGHREGSGGGYSDGNGYGERIRDYREG